MGFVFCSVVSATHFFVLLDGFDTFVAAPFIRHGNWQVSVKGRGCVEDSTETSGAEMSPIDRLMNESH